MIGKSIRSQHHLFRCLKEDKPQLALSMSPQRRSEVIAFLLTRTKHDRVLLIFNNNIGGSTISEGLSYLGKTLDNSMKEVISNFHKVVTIQENDPLYDYVSSNIILFDENFFDNYKGFLNENKKLIQSGSLKRFSLFMMDIRAIIAYVASNGSKNFFEWAVKMMYSNSIGSFAIMKILMWNETYQKLSSKLSKGTITAYNSLSDFFKLQEELSLIRREKRINDVINSFNTQQKKLFKENIESDEKTKDALSKFQRLSAKKKLNFIQKISSMEDYDEIKRLLYHTTSSHFSWSKDSFMDYLSNVEELNYEKIYDKDNIVILLVNDYETIKKLAKTTNWCISKNKSYFDNYVYKNGKSKQYMMFDFSKEEDSKYSIVGFTTSKNNGITHAHDFSNDNMMNDSSENNYGDDSYIKHIVYMSSIFTLLRKNNIDINTFLDGNKSSYEWTKQSFMEKTFRGIPTSEIDILMDKDEKMVVRTQNPEIILTLGRPYEANIGGSYFGCDHIFFCDFSKKAYDPNKFLMYITKRRSHEEDMVVAQVDSNFNQIGTPIYFTLKKFDLPIDTVRSCWLFSSLVYESIMANDFSMIDDKFSKEDIINGMTENIDSDELCGILKRYTLHNMSFGFIRMLYHHDISMTEVIGESCTSDFFRETIETIMVNGRKLMLDGRKPSDEEIECFLGKRLDNLYLAKYVGASIILNMIEGRELNMMDSSTHLEILYYVIDYGMKGELGINLLKSVLSRNTVDFTSFTRASKTLISKMSRCKDEVMKNWFFNEYISSIHSCEEVINFAKSEMVKGKKQPKPIEMTYANPFLLDEAQDIL